MAENKGRFYVVTERAGNTIDDPQGLREVKSIVRAKSQAQAISFKVKGRFTAEPADAGDVVTLMEAGVKVEDATALPDVE